jgi:hypothetical protein
MSLSGASTQVRRKVFVSYHHGGDQAYYDAFSKTFHDTYEAITDNSLEDKVNSSNVDYVMQRIRDNHLTGTSCTIVLVGPATWGRRYVDWEIKGTLDKEHGLVGIRLPTLMTNADGKVTVPGRLYDNINSGFAVWTNWNSVLKNPSTLATLVDRAVQADRKLIVNSRDRLQLNKS